MGGHGGEKPVLTGGEADEEHRERQGPLHGQTADHRRHRPHMLQDDIAEAAAQGQRRTRTGADRGGLVRNQRGTEDRGDPDHDGDAADDGRRRDQRGAGLDPPDREQHETEQCVRGEDVAVEQQHRVQRAEDEQPGEPAQERRAERHSAPCRGVELQGEAVAEQKGEQQVRLHREQQLHRASDQQVDCAVRRIVDQVEVVAGTEERDVHQQDEQQRAAPQCVHDGDSGEGVPGRGLWVAVAWSVEPCHIHGVQPPERDPPP
uniref:hypothetical protein n=1 Tax=Micromonospora noduli TaxID=709876 RepID=UPI0035A23510